MRGTYPKEGTKKSSGRTGVPADWGTWLNLRVNRDLMKTLAPRRQDRQGGQAFDDLICSFGNLVRNGLLDSK
jgi:hypothetical protein